MVSAWERQMSWRVFSLYGWVQEALETRKKEMTLAMVKSHAKLLRKYLADDAKVAAIVEIILHMQLGLYSLKRQEQARPQ